MRLLSTVVTTIVALTVGGCGSDSPSTSDGDSVEVLFPDAVELDTVSPDVAETSETTPADITTPLDTTTPDVADTTDTTPADTTPADTADTTDTTPADIADTADTTDTTPADTADTTDTTPADTSTPDTADTAPEDTADTTPADTAETTPECQLGGCVTDVSKLGNTCATAYVIGRPNAQSGFGHMASTVGAGNDSDFPQAACGDSGPDRFYKIYLKVGEQLWVNGNPSPAAYDLSYGLYRGENCETPITCVDNDINGTTPDTMPYQAVVEGWHVLVVDGRSTQGDYSLVVTLDCQEEDCCCR